MARWSQLVGSGLILAGIGGCGHASAPQVSPSVEPSQILPLPTPNYIPPGGTPGGSDPVRLLDAMRNALSSCHAVSATVRSWSEGHYKAGAKVTELRSATYVSRLLWAKPHQMRGDVLQTDNFLVGGASMITTDGLHVTVKGAGLLGIFPITLDASNGLLATNRNYGFADISPDAMIQRLMSPGATWTLVGPGQASGTPVVVVAVDHVRRMDASITRELLSIDPTTSSPREISMFEGNHRVVDIAFQTFQWNPTVPADAFN